MPDHAADLDDVLTALSEPIRRHPLAIISSHGEATATSMTNMAELPIARQAVAKHLTILEDAGPVAAHRHGREVRYAVRHEPLGATARYLAQIADEWDARLNAIKRIAESG
jgi:DNA-binding transcriptional ArsR family regulator